MSDLITNEQRKQIVTDQLRQFAGEAFGHQLARDRALARLEELPEGDPDRPAFEQAVDRSSRDLATLESAIKVNQAALADLD